MNTPKSFKNNSKNLLDLIIYNWGNLEEPQKSILIKIWKLLTYKWQLQILFNLPFLLWWLLDISVLKVHDFDVKLLSYLNLPDWAVSFIGFGQLSS
tara:strand:- start:720 stop:1007 length:288 start_codon:yes stop_codon:yes gene_type:complete